MGEITDFLRAGAIGEFETPAGYLNLALVVLIAAVYLAIRLEGLVVTIAHLIADVVLTLAGKDQLSGARPHVEALRFDQFYKVDIPVAGCCFVALGVLQRVH